MATVRIEVTESVATLTLFRPESLNAITVEMLNELAESLDALSRRDDVSVVILTGTGRAFSAGVDLKALAGRPLTGGSVGDVLDIPARRVIALLTTIPQIVIAKINGACFTGALELAMACDLIVVADEAKLGDTHAKWGLRPTWGMSQRLQCYVGVARSRELSYTARIFSGLEAAAWGLAVRSVPLLALDGTVDELVASITQLSSGSLAAYKDLYHVALDEGLEKGLAYEASKQFTIRDTEPRVSSFR